MNNLSKKTIFITGATKGIGKSCAFKFAEYGSNLILLGRSEELLSNIKTVLERDFKIKVFTIAEDINNYDRVKNSILNLPKDFSEIDILINNAGLAIGLDKVFTNEKIDIDTVIDTNVKSLIHTTNLILPIMLKRNSGHIVNLGSIAGDFAYPGGAIYCATKSAVKTFSDALRIDLVDTDIKVTNIKPGLVETEFSKVRFKGDIERANNTYKGIEPLTPDDIADLIVYTTNLPKNVQLTEITITPNHQADGRTVHRK